MYRVYSGPRGMKRLSQQEKARALYKEFGFLDDALSFAAEIAGEGRVPILIEGDNGTRLERYEIAASHA
jgi:hypothetical protein